MCCHGFSVNSLSQNFRAGNSNLGQALLMFFRLFPRGGVHSLLQAGGHGSSQAVDGQVRARGGPRHVGGFQTQADT